ncbi:ADP-dependent glucokinase/phosphofructokinase [uncultured Amnibacterium sp.]|uniref:ADP-dependent glucokinase/phosphofructokinase n=1 Tax=uncultured Amnibacterium sp. TaxID=1631851 RepID=UPI0035CC4624
MSMPAAPIPSTPPSADEVLLGLGNTVDYEIAWDAPTVSMLLRQHGVRVGDGPVEGAIETAADLLRALLAHVREGSGGEHFIASKAVLLTFAARFRSEITLGGTNVRAALAMRALGRPSTVHLVSTNDDTRRLLPDDVATISSADGDSLDPHVIVQFPAGTTVDASDGPVVAPRPNRVILTNDIPNRELVIAEALGDAVERAHVVMVSGFNSMQEPELLERRMTDVLRHIARRSSDSMCVYEHAAFHVAAFSERVREVVGPHVDIWCCNEEELQDHLGHELDLLDPREVLDAAQQLHRDVGAPSLVVHTRFWALAIGGPAARRRAMLFGGTALAGTRYAHGDAVTPQHLAEAAGWPPQAEGVQFAEAVEALGGDDVTCVASYRVPVSTPTTIGLGDAFVGGVVAALAALPR